MNIYLKMEIKARELEGRLLLGMVAAERGHTVLLGDVRPLIQSAELPAGLYHETALYPSAGATRFRRGLVERGWHLTSQDEEHGLLEPTYTNYARRRYSTENLEAAHAAFTWGPHDTAALMAEYPEHAAKVQMVGSPRIDLSRPEFAPMYRSLPRPGLEPARPYVLFANNFTRVIGTNRLDTFVRHMRHANYFEGDDDPFEFLQYEEASAQMDFLPHVIRGVRTLAKKHPDLTIVVRPHPQEGEAAWHDLLGDIPNLLISKDGSIGRWIRNAIAVVQSGDTTAFEATVAGTPVVAFAPFGDDHAWGQRYANRLGHRVTTAEQLVDAVTEIRVDGIDDEPLRERDLGVLGERIASLDGAFAVDRIVDHWAALGRDPTDGLSIDAFMAATRRQRLELEVRRALRPLNHRVRERLARRRSDRRLYLTAQKFPPISERELEELTSGYRLSLGRFEGVQVDRIGSRIVAIHPDQT